MRYLLNKIGIFIVILSAHAASYAQPQISNLDRSRNRDMLSAVKEEIANSYYDKKFHGVDLEANFRLAEDLLKKAPTNSEAFFAIAAFVNTLDDSHTFFVPPTRSVKYDHGWEMQMVGQKCFVVDVAPGSDAEKKGLKQGDEVLSIEGFRPNLTDFSKIVYVLYSLNPLPDFNLVIRTPGGEMKKLNVVAEKTQGRRITDLTDWDVVNGLIRRDERRAYLFEHRLADLGTEVMIWRMPEFDLTPTKVDEIMGRALKKKGVILDLRGNGGGREDMLLRLLGHLIDHDSKVGDIVRRKETKTLIAKSVGKNAFKGQVVVLVDSNSGSASEVLARVMQLEKRGVVVGDRSAGKVMRSMYHQKTIGLDIVTIFGISVTDADLVMSDGKSLEKSGVLPDIVVLPSAEDLLDQRDPALARAAAIVGVNITAEKAAALFPKRTV